MKSLINTVVFQQDTDKHLTWSDWLCTNPIAMNVFEACICECILREYIEGGIGSKSTDNILG